MCVSHVKVVGSIRLIYMYNRWQSNLSSLVLKVPLLWMIKQQRLPWIADLLVVCSSTKLTVFVNTQTAKLTDFTEYYITHYTTVEICDVPCGPAYGAPHIGTVMCQIQKCPTLQKNTSFIQNALSKMVFKHFLMVELSSMSWRSASRLFHAGGPT